MFYIHFLADFREKCINWMKALNDKLKQDNQLKDRLRAFQALEKCVLKKHFTQPFDILPARDKLVVKDFLEDLDCLEAGKPLPKRSKTETDLKLTGKTSETDPKKTKLERLQKIKAFEQKITRNAMRLSGNIVFI